MAENIPISRREFFCSSAAAAVAATTVPALASEEGDTGEKDAAQPVLPRRKLGRTDVEVTMLNLCHGMGIRYLDTAKSYLRGASERILAEWFEKSGHRKEHFLVTKHEVRTPDKWMAMIDERLSALKTDYLDMFFLHAVGDSDYMGLEAAQKCLADKEWARAADKIRKSGKCRLLGFSTHTSPIEVRAGVLEAAAKGSWVDAIMVAANPTVIRENAAFNKALDACHAAGIGLISMKECLGGPQGIKRLFPNFEEKGLSAFTAVLSAMWTDERFACVCSHMDTIEKLKENTTAARNFQPLTEAESAQVDTMLREGERSYCAGCDGSCREAGNTQADLNTIARYVSYAEEEGRVYEARELLTALPPEARDWSGADLVAASKACHSNLDFARIVARAAELLA